MMMENTTPARPLLEIKGMKKYFPIERGLLRRVVGHVKAVDDVTLTVGRGKTLGLVGESGSGKTTLGRCVLRAIEPTAGEALLHLDQGTVDLVSVGRRELKSIRKFMQMIFQDPYSSLDPRKTVFEIVSEPLRLNRLASGKDLEDRVQDVLRKVGLDPRYMKRYPHAFSGGQRQRIGIARALSVNPLLVVCDEAVSALDVSVQAQILNLLKDLQEDFHLTYLFIAHDLSVVEHLCDDVAVMYVGRVVEQAPSKKLFVRPRHPYTEALMASIPRPDPDHPLVTENMVEGEIPDPANPPSGCYFHPRCKYAQAICREVVPPLIKIEPEHTVACHFAHELTLQGVE
jgi:peptide/nickel transport system ATP-binding protein